LLVAKGMPERARQVAIGLIQGANTKALQVVVSIELKKWEHLPEMGPKDNESHIPLSKGVPGLAQALSVQLVAAAVERALSRINAARKERADILMAAKTRVAIAAKHRRGCQHASTKDAAADCPICIEKVLWPVTLPCGHVFFPDCILRTATQNGRMRRGCPLCRGPLFQLESLDELSRDNSIDENESDVGPPVFHASVFKALCGWYVYCSVSRY